MGLRLIAVQIHSGESCSFPLPGVPTLVGRGSEDATGKLVVNFDPTLSRRHFTITWNGERLRIQREPHSRRPLFVQGEETEDFHLVPGQHFTCGHTRFELVDHERPSEQPTRAFTIAPSFQGSGSRDASRCLQALLRLQPLLSGARDLRSFFRELLPILEDVLPAAAVIEVLSIAQDESCSVLEAHAPHGARPPMPSRTLVRMALDARKPAVYEWGEGCAPNTAGPTLCAGVRWALAAPIFTEGQTYALYAAGTDSVAACGAEDSPGALDRAILALVAEVVAQYLQGRRVQRLEGQLAHFFSPGLREVVLNSQESLLALGVREVTALFFDLRGFSRATERAWSQKTEEERWETFRRHHQAVREVMTLVTQCIFENEGIVIDFQGDAVFACWGAPLAAPDHALRAVTAARSIIAGMNSPEKTLGAGAPPCGARRCGIGLASGHALAGNVGVDGQIKYGIIGSCVNLASRLEGLTKYFRVPCLMSGETHRMLGSQVAARRIARVRPAGMQLPIDLYDLVLPRQGCGIELGPGEVADYESALEAFEAGRMEDAERLLRAVPLEDPVRRFLNLQVERLLFEGLPEEWDGIIAFTGK
ncbi:MAG: hypothetical protein HY319_05850 [Armatimonadetes bacterium]|nr:hypothetical protein [Armatimonadota bacterium]